MDWSKNHQPNFVRSRGSKAIPIINPNSGVANISTATTPIVLQNDFRHLQTLLAQVDLTAQVQDDPKRPLQVPVTTEPDISRQGTAAPTTSSQSSHDDELVRGFDVYATPFVPEKIKSINFLSGRTIEMGHKKRLDFDVYAGQSQRLSLLPPIPHPADIVSPEIGQQLQLGPKTYEQYFRFAIEDEINHQIMENASYSLYNHETLVQFLPDATTKVVLEVPGLRENSPYVEEDDLVELRQLRKDALKNRRLQQDARVDMKPWTGFIYRARVSAVLRVKETLLLDVSGLSLSNAEIINSPSTGVPLPRELPLLFNVQFPVPRERYFPMEHVLPHIQNSLNLSNNRTYRDDQDGEHDWIQSMLFPTEADCDVQANLHSGKFGQQWVDKNINWEQGKAVESICSQNYGVLPYLISGPPGTGKTKTLIETALQLIHNVDKVSHILLCAPSEPAADTLADRLRPHFTPHELLRLNRPSRGFSEVTDSLMPYCCILNDMFSLPEFEKLMSYRIVVTSCRDASMLMYGRVTNSDLYGLEYGIRRRIHPHESPPSGIRLHWDALLIDEAAQATEPEALVPLYVVAPPPAISSPLAFTPLVVMAGDEHQLGPRTSAAVTPLKRSLFARLFARPVYSDHPLARGKKGQQPPPLSKAMLPILRPAFVNLVRNYRSHPAILAVPSALFYFDTLEAEADAAAVNRLIRWDGWQRKPAWPLIFHDNRSPDDLERDGGGWFNPGEAELACEYAMRLVASGLVAQREVCIMSPFKSQVRRIRKSIRSDRFGSLWDVRIGPTEAFQGLEYGAVILCVTRSRARFVKRDRDLGWGVIGLPTKMNVALTRAKFGLIIIGHRDVLIGDPNWKAVLQFCDRNGLVVGRDGGTPVQTHHNCHPNELTRLEKVLLSQEGNQEGYEDRVLGGGGEEVDQWEQHQ
jgi:putative helicase MOV10L1/helicase MOV-10